MKNRTLYLMAISAALILIVASANAQGFGPGPGDGVCNFIDENGDGFNDLAPDHDGDGIPNGLDPDWVRPEDGSGYQHHTGQIDPDGQVDLECLFATGFGENAMGFMYRYGYTHANDQGGEARFGPGEGGGFGPGNTTGGHAGQGNGGMGDTGGMGGDDGNGGMGGNGGNGGQGGNS